MFVICINGLRDVDVKGPRYGGSGRVVISNSVGRHAGNKLTSPSHGARRSASSVSGTSTAVAITAYSVWVAW